MSEIPITVSIELHNAMAKATYPDFAASYLCGAYVNNGILRPRTETARRRLKDSRQAMGCLKEMNITLGASIPEDQRSEIPGIDLNDYRSKPKRAKQWGD